MAGRLALKVEAKLDGFASALYERPLGAPMLRLQLWNRTTDCIHARIRDVQREGAAQRLSWGICSRVWRSVFGMPCSKGRTFRRRTDELSAVPLQLFGRRLSLGGLARLGLDTQALEGSIGNQSSYFRVESRYCTNRPYSVMLVVLSIIQRSRTLRLIARRSTGFVYFQEKR